MLMNNLFKQIRIFPANIFAKHGTKGDGLHYDAPTNWAIYSYILEKLNKDAGGDPVTETECQAKAKKFEKQLSQKNY